MQVDIVRLGINGEGIFYVPSGDDKDKIGFVDFALPCETCDVTITNNKTRFCNAKLNEVLTKSTSRINPKCPYFFECGGCDLQHMDDSLQLEFKLRKVKDTISKVDKSFSDIQIISKNKFEYRNKMTFPFVYSQDEIKIGMFKKNSHDVIEIKDCLISKKGIIKVLNFSQKYFNENFKLFSDTYKLGFLKYLVIREVDDKLLVTIVASKKINLFDYYQKLNTAIKTQGLSLLVSDNSKDIMKGKYFELYGKNSIDTSEFGINYSINNLSFLQINDIIKKELYMEVIRNIGTSNVIDAFSGAGLMSAIIAKDKNVIGIEINKFASDIAQKLKLSNNITTLTNICGDANEKIRCVSKDLGDYTLILDPARSGCGEKLLQFLQDENNNLPKRIIYVSCNLATLERDLKFMINNFTINSVKAFDMFPNTKHIESLVVLDKIQE